MAYKSNNLGTRFHQFHGQDSSGCLSHVQHKCNLLVANCHSLRCGLNGQKTEVYPQIASNSHLSWDCDKLWILGVAHFQTIPSSNFEVGLRGESLFAKVYLQRWHKTKKNQPCVGERWWFFQVWCTCVPTMFGAMLSLFLVILSQTRSQKFDFSPTVLQVSRKSICRVFPKFEKKTFIFPCFVQQSYFGTTQAPTSSLEARRARRQSWSQPVMKSEGGKPKAMNHHEPSWTIPRFTIWIWIF